jgi:hypothetical protein
MSGSPVSIFISYSRKDEDLMRELVSHLEPLQRGKLISSWYDGQILPGEEWEPQLKTMLDQADIVLLLISKDFLNSDYCYEVELTTAIARYKAREGCVIPVILRPCLWHQVTIGGLRLSELQALPKDAKPVSRWSDPDDAFTNIAEGLLDRIRQLQRQQAQPTAPQTPVSAGTSPNFLQPAPETFRLKQATLSRQHFLKWGALSSVGLITAWGINRAFKEASPSTSEPTNPYRVPSSASETTNPFAPDDERPPIDSDADGQQVNFTRLENLLRTRQWQEADQETLSIVFRFAEPDPVGWGPQSDTLFQNLPCEVLSTLDQLWVEASGGKFGFSVQKRIYIEDCGGSLDSAPDQAIFMQFADTVGWLRVWDMGRNVSQVTYSLDAPAGHLPWKVLCGGEYCDGSSDELKKYASLLSRLDRCSL